MFIVEGRTLGVFAALGVVLSMVVVFDRVSDVADSTEPGSPAALATASTAPVVTKPERKLARYVVSSRAKARATCVLDSCR